MDQINYHPRATQGRNGNNKEDSLCRRLEINATKSKRMF